jgi:four helix bundle protein
MLSECSDELIAWQKAKELFVSLCALTRTKSAANDLALRDRIERAALAITSNLVEGFERGTQTEFCRFAEFAKGSCIELSKQLHIACDVGCISEAILKQYDAQVQDIWSRLDSLQRSKSAGRREAA